MRTMMKDTDCPMALWGEVVCAAAYCLNRTPTSANGGVSPFQAFEGIVPDVSHMRIFYADAYIHHSKSDGAKKLGDRAQLVKFVGYPDGVSGYKFYDPSARTITLSHSAHFLETTDTTPLSPASHSPNSANTFDDDGDNISITSDPDHPDPPTMDVPISHTPAPPPPTPAPSPPPPLAPPIPPRELCDCSQIRPPPHLDPTEFGAHG